jgi:hypothetical protein
MSPRFVLEPSQQSPGPFRARHLHSEVKCVKSLKTNPRKYLKFQKVAGNSANHRKNFVPCSFLHSRRNPLISRFSRISRLAPSTEHLVRSYSWTLAASASHVPPVTPFTKPALSRTILTLSREPEFFSSVNIRATLSHFPWYLAFGFWSFLCHLSFLQSGLDSSAPVALFEPSPVALPPPLVYVARH